MGGNAELELVDSLDPFSEGIVFSVMPPKKVERSIQHLVRVRRLTFFFLVSHGETSRTCRAVKRLCLHWHWCLLYMHSNRRPFTSCQFNSLSMNMQER